MTARARRFHFIYAALLLMFAMATFLILGRANADSPEGKRLPPAKPPAVSEHDMAMRSAMGINLAAGRNLLTTYSGETAITQLLEQNLTQPLALTSADFDEDGVPDLLSGYAGAGKGILTPVLVIPSPLTAAPVSVAPRTRAMPFAVIQSSRTADWELSIEVAA